MAYACRRAVRPSFLLCRASERVCKRRNSSISPVLKISSEVEHALASNEPVVALETTIYTHGFPYPDNLHLANRLETLVRENGAVPATIGVIDGFAHVGLDPSQLKALVERHGARKISRRDLAFATGLRSHGGTTISGTMVLAHLAGIKILGTGGLGGVHRGGENSLDISADLSELGRTPVAVFASGVKGFLDIPRTLEVLETQGVAVMTFADGRKGPVDFPAFWSRESGTRSPLIVENELEAASIIHAQFSLGVGSGLFFANPIPSRFSIPVDEMSRIVESAIAHADDAGASGSSNTPFILDAIKMLTGERSIVANRALIESNVVRASRVAKELKGIERRHLSDMDFVSGAKSTHHGPRIQHNLNGEPERLSVPPPQLPQPTNQVDLVVAGALAVDLSCDALLASTDSRVTFPTIGTSNPCQISQSFGGVAYNVAKAAYFMGASVKLIGAVADDLAGKAALASLDTLGMDSSGVVLFDKGSGAKTAQYISVNDSERNLVFGLSDMSILDLSSTRFEELWHRQLDAHSPKWVVVDANWDRSTISKWFGEAKAAKARTAFEPVSAAKAVRIFGAGNRFQAFPNHSIDLSTPNSLELGAMYTAARDAGLLEQQDWWEVIDALNIPPTGARRELVDATSVELVDAGIPQQSIQLLPFISCILTKLGHKGVLMSMLLSKDDERLNDAVSAPYILSRSFPTQRGVGGIYLRLFPAAEFVNAQDILSVNGVGDTFLGVLLAGLAKSEATRVEDLVDTAQKASIYTLKSVEAVSPHIASLRL